MSRHALVVGVGKYRRDHSLGALPAAHADIDAVDFVLRTRGDFTVQKLRDPSREELAGALEDLFKNRKSGDSVLLHFSGHGLSDDDKQRLYLAASDTVQDRPDSTAVNAQTVQTLLNETAAQTKFVFLDCCFAGLIRDGLRARSARKVPLRSRLGHPGTFMLTATDRTSAAFEEPTTAPKPALFTQALVEGLNGGAQDRDADGWISVQDAADFVQRCEYLTRAQRPMVHADGVTGELPLVRAASGQPPQPEAPAVVVADEQPEPRHDPSAPLDHDAFRRLAAYYVDCLRREADLNDRIRVDQKSRYRIWPGGPEAVFSGVGQPAALPEGLAEFVQRHRGEQVTFHYGYPVVVQVSGKGKHTFAPLALAEMKVDPSGVAHTDSVQLNDSVLRDHDLDAHEIVQLRRHFSEGFRHSNPQRLLEQLRQTGQVLGMATPTEIDPTGLDRHLKTSPPSPGVHNVAVLYYSDGSADATDGLIKDLSQELVDKPVPLDDTALGALATGDCEVAGDPGVLLTPGPVNEAQEDVIASAMTRRLTVATGPPGTGKTALVTALTATAVANGQSILVGSTNNEAVNGVCDKANDICDGLMIRTGNRQFVEEEPKRLSKLLSHPPKAPADENLLSGRLRAGHRRMQQLRDALNERRRLEADLRGAIEELQRVRASFRQDDPLLAHVDGDTSSLEKLARRARRSLSGWPRGIWARHRMTRLGADSISRRQALAVLLDLEVDRRELTAQLSQHDSEFQLWSTLKQSAFRRVEPSRQTAVAHMARNVQNGGEALKKRIESLQQERPNTWSGFRRLLHTLPAWAVTGHSSRRLVPAPGMFDLVVIDEAAQCPVPTMLGLLLRAKRALIIGDPHQIPPVAVLGKEEDDRLRRKHKLGADWMRQRRLTYSDGSIYHAGAAAADSVTLLDEHYRCHPDIAATPNREVYHGKLVVLTDTEQLKVPSSPDESPAVHVVDVPGTTEYPTQGSCHNPTEINHVAKLTADLISRFPDASIGVIAPFTAHISRLNQKLSALGIDRDVVRTGTVHRFQGGERDIVILSAVGSKDIRPHTAQWITQSSNLWNVAVTRAKSKLVVVCDRDWWESQSSLLTEVIRSAETQSPRPADPEPTDNLQQMLEARGVEILGRDRSVAGQPCQLLLAGSPRPRAVVVDSGRHESDRTFRQLLARMDLIAAAGHEPIRVPAWRCLAEPAKVAEELSDHSRPF